MEKIQMRCTEEQFNRDLKPFLVDAGVDLSQCYAFEINDFLQTNYNPINIVGTWTRSINYKTIDYNPKQFLKHLGIDIYEVGDVVEYLGYNYEVSILNSKYCLKRSYLVTKMSKTLYELNKTIQFLKSHEKPVLNIKVKTEFLNTLKYNFKKTENKMQEKPFTIEQAKEMLLNEKLKELAFRYYPELKSPVNPIDEDLLEKLSINMFGNANKILIAKQSAISINRVDLDGKSLIVDETIEIILHKVFTGGTLIEFKYK
jgi:hypothetical protein